MAQKKFFFFLSKKLKLILKIFLLPLIDGSETAVATFAQPRPSAAAHAPDLFPLASKSSLSLLLSSSGRNLWHIVILLLYFSSWGDWFRPLALCASVAGFGGVAFQSCLLWELFGYSCLCFSTLDEDLWVSFILNLLILLSFLTAYFVFDQMPRPYAFLSRDLLCHSSLRSGTLFLLHNYQFG